MNLMMSATAAEIDTLNEIAWNAQYTDPATTLTLATRCIALAQATNQTHGLAYALLNKAFYEIRFCPALQAEDSLRAAQTHFEALGDRRGQLLVQSGFAGILLKRHEYDAAQMLLEQVLEAPEQDRLPLDGYFALYRLGYVHFYRGEVQEGLRYYYRALALVQRECSLPLSCQALSDLGSAQMELGNYEEARQLLEQAHGICGKVSVCFAHLIIGNLASVHLEMGNAATALRIVQNDFPVENQFFQRGDQAFLDVVAAQAYAGTGDWEAAHSHAMRALRRAEQDNHPEIHNQCLWMLGVIACGRRQPDTGIQWLRQAEAGFEEIRNPFYVLHVYQALADAYADMGQFDLAYLYLQRYQKHYEESRGTTASARFFTLQIQHELAQAELERDYALQQQTKLEALNRELQRKVAEVEQLQIALREQAVRDPLTGLYNRRFLSEQIGPILDQATRNGYMVSIVLIDLDGFKRINDTLGHGFGDQVLIDLAALLRSQIRSSDLAVRYGGEEFCLVFPMATAADTQARMESLLKDFHNCAIVCCDKFLTGLTFSGGIAQFPVHGTSELALLQTADKALYRAKHEGRNRILLAPCGNM